jgi:hypothetical protein
MEPYPFPVRSIEITRDESECLVDLLEYPDPKVVGTWGVDLAARIRETFGMIPKPPDDPPKP